MEKLIEKFIVQFGLDKNFVDSNLVCVKHKNGENLLIHDNFDSQSLFLYHYDEKKDMFSPIMQIKYIDRKLDKKEKELYIRRLEFIDNNFKGKGYASTFMKGLTRYCIVNNIDYITGEFEPLHNEPVKKVRDFYIRNGFAIYTPKGDKQQYIYKSISFNIEEDMQNLSKYPL